MTTDKKTQMTTDEELIEKIRSGDDNAESELFDRYKDLVVKIARGYYLVGGDLEDLIQEGMIGLYNAIKNFSPKKEASFKTFAVVCVKHQIQNAIRRANTNKNKPLSTAVSFQSFNSSSTDALDCLPVELVFSTTPAESMIDKENFEHIKSVIKSTLTTQEMKVLLLYLQGFSYREISKNISLSQKAIDNTLTRIKIKLREKLKN